MIGRTVLRRLARLTLLWPFTLGAQAQAQEVRGVTPAGAAFAIARPVGWQPGDGLVLVQHGFRFEPDRAPDLGPLRDRMLADGWAVAASGYRQRGWAVFRALDDNLDLLAEFRARYGEPGPLLAAGGSMGGLIALRLAEDPRFRADIEGVLAFCPVSDGLAAWEQAFDLRLAYDAICAEVDGGDLPRGRAPTPWALDPEQIPPQGGFDEPALLAPVAAPIAACTGLGLPAAWRSAGMRERLARLARFAGTADEAGLLQQLGYAIYGLAELLRAPDKLAGQVPFDNLDARYESTVPPDPVFATLGERMLRVDGDGLARLRLEDAQRLDGSAAARIVSLHTAQDPVVAPRQQAEVWRRYVPRGAALIALADEATPSHCQFSDAERVAGWEVLQGWRARPREPAPTPAELQQACLQETTASGDCRWRATTLAALEASGPQVVRRTPPRRAPLSGLWYDPARSGQGLMLEELERPYGAAPGGELRVATSWYTWAPGTQSEAGPRWLIGVGRLRDAGVVVDPLLIAQQGSFGTRAPGVPAALAPWGRLELVVERDGVRMHHQGPPTWGAGSRAALQLTASGHALPFEAAPDPPPAARFARLGTYYAPAYPGQGWVLNQFARGPHVASALIWYTFDSSGRPVWMVGLDERDDDGLFFRMRWSTGGGRFDAAAPPLPEWGDVWLETDACAVTAVAWRADTHGFGDGRMAVVRLTRPYEAALGSCPR